MLATPELLQEFQKFAQAAIVDQKRVVYIDELFNEWYDEMQRAITLEAIAEADRGEGRCAREVTEELFAELGIDRSCRTKS